MIFMGTDYGSQFGMAGTAPEAIKTPKTFIS